MSLVLILFFLPVGDANGRNPARLSDDDVGGGANLVLDAVLQDVLGNLGCLAAPRLAGDHDNVVVENRADDLVAFLVNR